MAQVILYCISDAIFSRRPDYSTEDDRPASASERTSHRVTLNETISTTMAAFKDGLVGHPAPDLSYRTM